MWLLGTISHNVFPWALKPNWSSGSIDVKKLMQNSIFLVFLGNIETWLQPDEAGRSCQLVMMNTRKVIFEELLMWQWHFGCWLHQTAHGRHEKRCLHFCFADENGSKLCSFFFLVFQKVWCCRKTISALAANFSLLSPFIFSSLLLPRVQFQFQFKWNAPFIGSHFHSRQHCSISEKRSL